MRRAFSINIILFLILSGFGLTIIFDFTTQNAVAVDEYIDVNTVWSGDRYVNGNVFIKGGVTLTINPGTNVIFNGDYNITVNNTGNLTALGNKNQKITFSRISAGLWGYIYAEQLANVKLDWCLIERATDGIRLNANKWRTEVSNCTFQSCIRYFNLTDSIVNVTSCNFTEAQFDSPANLTSNLGKVGLEDDFSYIYIQYYVNVDTVNGTLDPLPGITINANDQASYNPLSGGKTDSSGKFYYYRATSARISGSASPSADFTTYNNNTVEVKDKWYGVGQPFEEPGISHNATEFNASSIGKSNDLYIELQFTFKYPPKITIKPTSTVIVNEDTSTLEDFVFHDNDDFDTGVEVSPGVFDNITVNITDQNGNGIYGTNNQDKWISWNNLSKKLVFFRTIESPWTTPGTDDYKAQVNEIVNVTIIDLVDQRAWTGPLNVEFHNVPDKPDITGLPAAIDIVTVIEDQVKYLPITVTDNDNSTDEVDIISSSDYVTYQFNGTNDQCVKLLYPNEFGENNTQELVYVNATDNCVPSGASTIQWSTYSFLVRFIQTPDPPEIINAPIPNYKGDEDSPIFELALGDYAYDPDPDDNAQTLKWYVTGLDSSLFEVQNVNSTADTPLSFNLISGVDLGGATNARQVEDTITLWLKDKDGLTANQNIKIYMNSTNQPPSLHKIDKEGKKVSVWPEDGFTADRFRFMIEYRDRDGEKGDPPAFLKVYIDGVAFDMLAEDATDDNYKDGKVYYYEIASLSAGEHEHYFECSDGAITTRLPLITAEPNNFSGPDIEAKIFILTKETSDGNFIARIAHSNLNPFAEVIDDATKPSAEIEPDKDTINKTKGDIGVYFQVNTQRIDFVYWVEFTVKFGSGEDYDDNYNGTKWLRKDDLRLGYYSPQENKWYTLTYTQMDINKHILKCNITLLSGDDELLMNIVKSTGIPTFTVIGTLDADGDNFLNDREDFPFDPSCSKDSDGDDSPDKWHTGWTFSPKGRHLDAFPNDPAASLDTDHDNCPDKWNPGKNRDDSTSDPKLDLDKWPENPNACLDTDNDNMPDQLRGSDPVLQEDTDDDNDGMPDWWEEQWLEYAKENDISNLLDPKNGTDANKDWDGDGRSNLDEYRKESNPYKKDAEEDGIFGGSNMMTTLLIIVIIIIVVILILGFILKKKGKKEPEELPRGMGAPPPEAEVDEGALPPETEAQAPVPEGEEPLTTPPMPETEAEAEAGVGFETEETGVLQEDEGIVAPPPEEAPEAPEETTEPQTTPETETTEEPQVTTEEIEFTCPNCKTPLSRDMTQCPGCSAPLQFD
jgi:hypothetical protein